MSPMSRRRHAAAGPLGRLAKLRAALARQDLGETSFGDSGTGMLVSGMANIRYLTGFTGSSGYLIITPDETVLRTDGRYTMQARRQTSGIVVAISERRLLADLAGDLKQRRIRTLIVEENRISFAVFRHLREALRGRRIAPLSGLVEGLRLVKDADEIGKMRRSAALNGEAFERACSLARPRWTERRFAAEINYQMQKLGAEGAAFGTIVAGGERSALPHAEPADLRLPRNALIVVDQGAILDGYASDMTRPVCFGKLAAAERNLFQAVREAQLAALDGVRAGVRAGSVDRKARQVLRKFRLEKAFSHSTGHGLGLEIHESPRLGPSEQTRLRVGMVITIEPGVYVEGLGGVRIEDTVVVTKTGCEILTSTPKELRML